MCDALLHPCVCVCTMCSGTIPMRGALLPLSSLPQETFFWFGTIDCARICSARAEELLNFCRASANS